MAVTDKKIHKDAKVAIETLVVPIITAVSQSDVIAQKMRVPYDFEIVGVEGYCRTEAGAVTGDVKIGTTSVLSAAIAFATGSRVAGALSATVANLRGLAGSDINVHYTSDGTGALTNGFITIHLRRRPLANEAA